MMKSTTRELLARLERGSDATSKVIKAQTQIANVVMEAHESGSEAYIKAYKILQGHLDLLVEINYLIAELWVEGLNSGQAFSG